MALLPQANGFFRSMSKARSSRISTCYVKAGGPQRAYIETVPVEVTDGKLDITFTSNVENPEINGIEILPAP